MQFVRADVFQRTLDNLEATKAKVAELEAKIEQLVAEAEAEKAKAKPKAQPKAKEAKP